MSPLPYVPARDQRHRTAALALFRALARAARRLPLPPDLPPAAPVVRRRFAKNRAYTSPRLVAAALAAGYRFLALLARARDPAAPEHARVVALLRRGADAAAESRRRGAAARPPVPLPPPPRSGPLLRNVAAPGALPRYASAVLPRPPSALAGPRRVPSLCSTAFGQPFVRIAKPQPRALSRMVGLKDRIFRTTVAKLGAIDDDLLPAAQLEDDWERLVALQMRAELGASSPPPPLKDSYAWTLQVSRFWIELRLERTWHDWTARGTALSGLVEQERALAEREKPRPTRGPASWPLPPPSARPNVGLAPHQPFALIQAHNNLLNACARDASAPEDANDPFISPAWATLVEAEEPRLLKWHRAAFAKDGAPESSWAALSRQGRRAA